MNEKSSRAYEFLNLYRELEEALTVKYASSKKKYTSVVVQFLNDPDGKKYHEELNLFREIRNLLSHHADIDGENIVEPSEAVIEILHEILNTVKNPPVALHFATAVQNLAKTYLDAPAIDVIRMMKERGFSHIPVMEEEHLFGVFSVSTLFSHFQQNGAEKLSTDTKIGDFEDFLPIQRHDTETFRFLSEQATYYDIKDEFSSAGPKKKRLAAIFITSSGKITAPLQGMITPWDVIRKS